MIIRKKKYVFLYSKESRKYLLLRVIKTNTHINTQLNIILYTPFLFYNDSVYNCSLWGVQNIGNLTNFVYIEITL